VKGCQGYLMIVATIRTVRRIEDGQLGLEDSIHRPEPPICSVGRSD
jgi:hypothetical protein